MSNRDKIDSIIHSFVERGDSCVELAEFFVEEAEGVDKELHEAMVALNEAATRMISRLEELNDEHSLGYEFYFS